MNIVSTFPPDDFVSGFCVPCRFPVCCGVPACHDGSAWMDRNRTSLPSCVCVFPVRSLLM